MNSVNLDNRYGIRVLPTPVEAPEWETPGGRILNHGRAYLWSGKSATPPALGDRVTININDFGSGTVDSYFLEYGWLGVRVKLDAPPAWHVKQSKGTPHEGHALVFGAELAG